MCVSSDGTRNIVLVGFMGSGKTSVGAELARRLGWELVDTDELVEARAGTTIVDIFAREGEARFRDLETAAVREAASRRCAVIATGGGAVLRQENVAALRESGTLFLLDATAEELFRRVMEMDHPRRPLLDVPDPMRAIRELLHARRPFYGLADVEIPTTGRAVDRIVEDVLRHHRSAPNRGKT
jgi:shikimate kinase